jgi:hypothetical protein
MARHRDSISDAKTHAVVCTLTAVLASVTIDKPRIGGGAAAAGGGGGGNKASVPHANPNGVGARAAAAAVVATAPSGFNAGVAAPPPVPKPHVGAKRARGGQAPLT